jgi:hypothetical protein
VFLFFSIEMELLKNRQQITNKQLLYNVPLLKPAFLAFQDFLFMIFKQQVFERVRKVF